MSYQHNESDNSFIQVSRSCLNRKEVNLSTLMGDARRSYTRDRNVLVSILRQTVLRVVSSGEIDGSCSSMTTDQRTRAEAHV